MLKSEWLKSKLIDKTEWLLIMLLVSPVLRRIAIAVIRFKVKHLTVSITLRKEGERKEKGRRKEGERKEKGRRKEGERKTNLLLN